MMMTAFFLTSGVILAATAASVSSGGFYADRSPAGVSNGERENL
jgi:hypothetical protein